MNKDLLAQCAASGQMDSRQIAAHLEAGELQPDEPVQPSSIVRRFTAWMQARADRKLLARVISEADAALEARGRGDMEAYRRHASLAQALSARRRG